LQATLAVAVVGHFINRCGAETLTRIAVFFRAAGRANVRVQNMQMRRLIFM